MTAPLKVVGIGNAIVDVISRADDAFIETNALNKGGMTLIDADQAEALYQKMGSGIEISGGSAANTMAGLASFGSKGAFIGKVGSDQLGSVFAHDIRAIGVDFNSSPLTDATPTARCLILVTPDAQRTMNTFLGACTELGPEDVDQKLVENAQVTYMEGYLWDKPKAKEAFIKAADIAHGAGRKVSLTLSDSFCVDRHRESFRDLVNGHIDVLFANENEITSLYQVPTVEEALGAVRQDCQLAVVTRSEKGSVVVAGTETYQVEAASVDRVVDTTGAGDLYAAGFLHGLTEGLALPECARLGSLAAAEVIGHFGARPEIDLSKLVAKAA
ncbi:adenosine kinase [Fodinicurvata sp. EGI_FJ10296]|uniref:adenosine kinase n=1 Tax=Fodinicurvata sp. EGI_FJ10296 TaxID=3231908 RepID=UPI003451516B